MSEAAATPAAAGEILTSSAQGIGRITVSNAARRNALTLAMKQQLAAAFEHFDADPATRCIVLGGAGDKSFISGADISEFEQVRGKPELEEAYGRITSAAQLAPVKVGKPVIASIRGACAGGGLQMAVSCDMRIAARSSFFMMPAAKLGIGYPYQTLALFTALLGRGATAELFMTGRRVGADEALALGLVNKVVDDDALEQAVTEHAAMVAGNAPLSLKAFKQALAALSSPAAPAPAGFDVLLGQCATSQDAVEGRTAFLEKRKPVFQGR